MCPRPEPRRRYRRGHTGETDPIPQRRADHAVADPVHHRFHQGRRLAGQPLLFQRDRTGHENVEQLALERCGILHAHLNARQHLVPGARGREVEGWRGLPQVMQHRFLPFGNVGDAGHDHRCRDDEGEIADPGHREIGEELVMAAEIAAGGGIQHAPHRVLVGKGNAFRHARCAGGMQQHRIIPGLGGGQQARRQLGLFREPLPPAAISVSSETSPLPS